MNENKLFEWQDVTGGYEVVANKGGSLWASVRKKGGKFSIPGNLYWRPSECVNNNLPNDLRIVSTINTFRIERRVEVAPEFVFTYTPEFVASLDCKNMSVESVLHHCVLKWDEVVRAHEAGVIIPDMYSGPRSCPACSVYFENGCIGCPLGGIPCCGDRYEAYRLCRSIQTAAAVRDYIQGKLDEIRKAMPEPKEPKRWVPKVGDWVRDHNGRKCRVIKILDGLYDARVYYPNKNSYSHHTDDVHWGHLRHIKDDSC